MDSLYINGEWETGKGAMFSSVNPANNEVVWQGKEPMPAQIEMAVKNAKQSFKQWMLTSYEQRVEIVNEYAKQVEANKALIAETIAKEVGKPLWEAHTEVQAMIAKTKIAQQSYQDRTGSKKTTAENRVELTRHKPHGVFAAIGPFNFPANIPNSYILSALLAGNTIVLKPSELTPMTAEVVVRCWQAAGLPPGVLNLVQGTSLIGEKLLANLNINGVMFTGSYRTGLKIHKQFAARPEIIVAMEMGGNNPLVVMDVNDIEAAAYHTVQSAYITAGQRCTCARRLIVPHGSQGDQFIDALLARIGKIRVGSYQHEPEPFMGPVISHKQAQHLLSAQDDLIKQGAKVLSPMEHLALDTGLVSPALLDVTTLNEKHDQEFFGPLLQLIRVDDFQHAITEANKTCYGLAAGLLADDERLFQQFYQEVNAGIINWNMPLTGASALQPFGGIGHSGNHRPSAYYTADTCAYPVASIQAPTLALPAQLTPGFK